MSSHTGGLLLNAAAALGNAQSQAVVTADETNRQIGNTTQIIDQLDYAARTLHEVKRLEDTPRAAYLLNQTMNVAQRIHDLRTLIATAEEQLRAQTGTLVHLHNEAKDYGNALMAAGNH